MDENTRGRIRRMRKASGFDVERQRIIREHEEGKNVPKTNFYFAIIPERLLEDRNVSGNAVKLFGLLHCACWNKRNPVVETLNQKVLAEKMGMSVRSIGIFQKELEGKGWIRVIRNGSENKPNKISLNLTGKGA